jgi:NADPH2 dehydrogenase
MTIAFIFLFQQQPEDYVLVMETDTPLTRNSSLQLRNSKTLRNRVVVPPMASQTADHSGFVTTQTLNHYLRLSRSRPGLLIVEYTFVHASGRSETNQLGISSDAHTPGLKDLATLIKEQGALAGIQITHSGAKSDRDLTDGRLMGPSAVPVPVKDREMSVPEAMTEADIELWKASFLAASDRAVKAGFDLIEFHAAHGYGLNQWLSPLTNRRQDRYGMNAAGRMKLPLEILSQVRARHPEILISVRMPGQDFIEGGASPEEMIWFAKNLESLKVDLIHVSSGIGGWRRPSVRSGEGYLVPEAARIQASVSVPVIGVGGMETGEYIDQELRNGSFHLAAVGRAILRNPEGWHELQMSGSTRSDDNLRTAVNCLELGADTVITCSS